MNEILSIATIRPEVVQNKFCPFSPGFQYSADGSDPIAFFQSLGMVYVSYSTLSGWPLSQLGAISPKDDPHVGERRKNDVLSLGWLFLHANPKP